MSDPIRVLELRSVYGTGGGPDKTILLGTQRTDRSRFAITVCYLRAADDGVFALGARARELGLDYVEIPERHSFDRSVWPALRQIMRDRHIDIVHGHEYKTDLLAFLLARAEGAVALATAHGWTGHSPRERRIYYPADKWLLGRFPHVVAVSGEIKSELVRWGAHPERITVVLNGIDPAMFRRDATKEAAARARFGLSGSDVVFGSVGRLEPQKRFDLLIQAMGDMRRRVPQAKLVIAGDGSLRQALESQIAQAGLSEVCRLVGHCQDVIGFHHALNVFVQSSDYEGTPNVVLEAMALETPTVATAVGGTAELMADGVDGLLIPPGSVPKLVEAMIRAIDAPSDTRARAVSARRRIETELSFDQRLRRVEAIYTTLMSGRRPVRQPDVPSSAGERSTGA